MKARLFIILILGIGAMLSFSGCAERIKYEKFFSDAPGLNLEMEYPLGWSQRLQKGTDYTQVIFTEPERENKIFKAAIVLTAKEAWVNLEEAASDLVRKRMGFKEAKLLSRAKIKAAQVKGISLFFSYKALDQIRNLKQAKAILVKERIVILAKGNKIYTIRYQNTAEEFAKFNPAFSQSLKTLRIR